MQLTKEGQSKHHTIPNHANCSTSNSMTITQVATSHTYANVNFWMMYQGPLPTVPITAMRELE